MTDRQIRMWKSGVEKKWVWKVVSPGKNTPSGCAIPNGQPWKHTHKNLWTEQVVYMYLSIYICVHVFVYIYACNNNLKRDHELWKEQRGICESSKGAKGEER